MFPFLRKLLVYITKFSRSMNKSNGVDFISNLPDPILEKILSGIPYTEEVIRTSILSKRWRYLWTSVPSLDIDCFRVLDPSLSDIEKSKFKEFMYWVLLNKTVDMETFRLRCSTCYDMSTIWRWIHVAVMRKVKLLDLMFSPKDEYGFFIELPHCLVTCESLEILKLCLLTHTLKLPSFTGFPSLRVLELEAVDLFEDEDDLVEDFFKNCPSLEDLSFIDCVIGSLDDLCISCPKLKTLRFINRDICNYLERDVCGGIKISCPKLVFLEFVVPMAYRFVFENLDSLKKAVIHAEYTKHETSSFDLINGVYHVEYLSLNLDFIQFYHECIDDALEDALDLEEDFPESLPNLKTLEVTNAIDIRSEEITNLLIWILGCSPNLESFHLTIQEELLRPEYWKLDEVETMRILTRRLKRVEILEFNGEKAKLDIARVLLEHGNALEEMVFSWRDIDKYHDLSMKTVNEVSKFYTASSTVKLTAAFLKEE